MLGHSTLARQFLRALCFGSVLTLVSLSAPADSYKVGAAATVDDITVEYQATPPSTRIPFTVGIGEKVDCSIDTDSWSDSDYNVTQQRTETDTIGDITWTCTALSDINPTTGSATVFTAEKSATPPAATVRAKVYDSETKYDDCPVEKSVVFAILVPISIASSVYEDLPWPSGTTNFGGHTTFTLVLGPTTVSFANIQVKEFFPEQSWTWPNTSTTTVTAFTEGPVDIDSQNRLKDTVGDKWSVLKLDDGTSGTYTFTTTHDMKFANDMGTWVEFFTNSTPCTSNKTLWWSQIGHNGAWGAQMGPWD